MGKNNKNKFGTASERQDQKLHQCPLSLLSILKEEDHPFFDEVTRKLADCGGVAKIAVVGQDALVQSAFK